MNHQTNTPAGVRAAVPPSVHTILETLIAFRTEATAADGSPRPEHTKALRDCLAYVETLLQQAGCRWRLRLPTSSGELLLAGLNTEQQADINHGLLLCGHLDVVGGDATQFIPRWEGDRLCGRGTVDMKGSLACFLHLLPWLRERPYPVLLAFTTDEESSMEGVQVLCRHLTQQRIRPALTLLGEPTAQQLGIASCGLTGYRTELYGKAAHSSRPQDGINALYLAARLLTLFEEQARQLAPQGLYLNAGRLEGGCDPATVPDRATLHWGYRAYEVLRQAPLMRAYHATIDRMLQDYPSCLVQSELTCHFPSYWAEDSAQVERLCRQLGCQAVEIPYTTEAGYLQLAGQNVYLFGAGQPSEAHTAHESIRTDELNACTQGLRQLCLLLETSSL